MRYIAKLHARLTKTSKQLSGVGGLQIKSFQNLNIREEFAWRTRMWHVQLKWVVWLIVEPSLLMATTSLLPLIFTLASCFSTLAHFAQQALSKFKFPYESVAWPVPCFSHLTKGLHKSSGTGNTKVAVYYRISAYLYLFLCKALENVLEQGHSRGHGARGHQFGHQDHMGPPWAW